MLRKIWYFFAAFLFTTGVFSSGSADFNYKLNGADWGTENPLCSTGKAQSPIDLKDASAMLSDVVGIRGLNYPDDEAQTLSRIKATSVPSDLGSEL